MIQHDLLTPITRKQLLQILNLARWAPSGDNVQPWRLNIAEDNSLLISYTYDPNSLHVVPLHDNGQPDVLSCGMFIENLMLAAQADGYACEYEVLAGEEQPRRYLWRCRFTPTGQNAVSPLMNLMTRRRVDRYPYRTKALAADLKQQLEACIKTPGLEIVWLEGLSWRWRMARLLTAGATVRCLWPAMERANATVLDYTPTNSPDRMPVATLPLDPATRLLMRIFSGSPWVMSKMRWVPELMGPVVMQMDFLPSFLCGAQFLLVDRQNRLGNAAMTLQQQQAFITEAGRDTQRLWLTAVTLGLSLQPAYTPIFLLPQSEQKQPAYGRVTGLLRKFAQRFQQQVMQPHGITSRRQLMFVGRLGHPWRDPNCRPHSDRLPVERLIDPVEQM